MHRGRRYRQVLPPMMSENFQVNARAPVRLFWFGGYSYSGGQVDPGTSVMSSLPTLNLPQIKIQWSLPWSSGLFDFTTIVQQQAFSTKPEFEFQFFTQDNFGNANITLWEFRWGGRWDSGLDHFQMTLLDERSFGLFGRSTGFRITPVYYPEEP